MTSADSPPDLPDSTLDLRLRVTDPEVVAELLRVPEGAGRDAHAAKALKIGLIALKHVRGDIDGDTVRREGERILSAVEAQLEGHDRALHARLGEVLKGYFHPESGRFAQRVRSLVAEDGELARVLRGAVGQDDDSELVKTLRAHFGPESPLMKTLSPTESEGLLFRLSEAVRKQVEAQRDRILAEFTLDRPESAVARMRRDLLEVLASREKDDSTFREAVLASLGELRGRKAEAARSTRHGLTFEQAVFERIQTLAQGAGDVATFTGNTTGRIRNNKKGDVVLALGPEAAGAGTRVVIEAKEEAGYSLQQALAEVAEARKNRAAETGVFVFSRRSAPAGLRALQRLGPDVVLVWDAEDDRSDVFLEAGVTVAKALCTRGAAEREVREVDLTELDRAILEVEKQSNGLAEIGTWATTIQSNSEKILRKVATAQKAFERQVHTLRDILEDLRST